MATPVYFSPRVIDTVTSLPEQDRIPVANALSMEFVLGLDPMETLTPVQGMVYAMIRFYVKQDEARRLRNEVQGNRSKEILFEFEPRRSALG